MSGSAHPCALQGCDLDPGVVWSRIWPWDRGQAPVLSQHWGLVEAQRALEKRSTDALRGLML